METSNVLASIRGGGKSNDKLFWTTNLIENHLPNREQAIAKKRSWRGSSALLALSCCLAGLVSVPALAEPDPVFDPAAAIVGLEPGEATLTGRPGASRRSLPNAKEPGKVERVYSQNEVVYLLPFSPFVQATVDKYANNIGVLVVQIAPAQEYSARVLTDENGYFTFRGLKPGRYLLMTAVPYEAEVSIREDTGKTRTDTQYSGTQWFGPYGAGGFQLESSTSITSPIYRYRSAISDLEHRIVKVVEVSADKPTTNLGELQ